jgi:MucR family transcriptional regulator, transcriptional regulator of exopolysaccharide biosynthesis
MAENNAAAEIDLYQVAHIVSSYVRRQQMTPDQLVDLIIAVHRALASLGRAAPSGQEPLQPAVPIRRSGEPDYVVCLGCGFRAKTLRRHLTQIAYRLGVSPATLYRDIPAARTANTPAG